MNKAYSTWSMAAIVFYGVGVCMPPAAIILGSGCLIKPFMVTIEANEFLNSGKTYKLPDWINECSGGDQQFPMEKQFNVDRIEETVDKMNSLEICLTTNFILIGFIIFLLLLRCPEAIR